MCPGGQSSTKVSAKVSAKAAVVKVKKTARASPKMKATAETLRQDFTSKAELLVAVTPQEIQRKPRLSLAETPSRFRMMLCMDDNIAARLPSFYPPSIDEHDLKKKQVTNRIWLRRHRWPVHGSLHARHPLHNSVGQRIG